ncbi:MAG TPA: NAD-dependent epimerase/dehydratase family protein [Chthoniobacterales bacterium]|nr:NAD-dependent epimerase/dehydratase family protein [Chthoniobacterales bacterium]
MARALIAGCGYLGRAIADLLLADGWEVEGWTRSEESARKLSLAGYPAHHIDISNSEDVAARKTELDIVIHSASTRGGDVDAYRSVYLDGTRNLLENFAGAQFVFISSTSVYAQTGGEWVTEESPADPKPETGKILRASEDLLRANGGVIVRLGGLYGPGRSALLRKLLSGEAKIDPASDRFLNQIHRDDAAAAIRFLIQGGNSSSQIYNLVDNQPVLLSECYRWLAVTLNRPVPSTATSVLQRKRGDSNKRVSNGKLRSLGWTLQYPTFADGMAKSVLKNSLGGDA